VYLCSRQKSCCKNSKIMENSGDNELASHSRTNREKSLEKQIQLRIRVDFIYQDSFIFFKKSNFRFVSSFLKNRCSWLLKWMSYKILSKRITVLAIAMAISVARGMLWWKSDSFDSREWRKSPSIAASFLNRKSPSFQWINNFWLSSDRHW